MKKIDPTILRETAYIASFTFLFSILMQSVFLILGYWEMSVLFGNLLGGVAAVGNFFLLGLTVQSALGKEQKEAANRMKLSQTGRMFLLLLVALVGYLVPVFHTVAVILPYLFPRIAIALRPCFEKKNTRS